MSYFNRNKWWAIAFIALLVMNVATLATVWLLKEKQPVQRMGGGRGVVDFLVKELGLDSLQKQKLLALRSEHMQQVAGMRAKTREAKDALFELLKQPGLPDSVLERAAYASSVNDQQLDIITFRHLRKIRELCTAEQKLKFDAVIKEVLRSMGPMPPPPGNHRPGEHGPGEPPPGAERGEMPPPPPQ